jgi:hypothetical protein
MIEAILGILAVALPLFAAWVYRRWKQNDEAEKAEQKWKEKREDAILNDDFFNRYNRP